MTIDDEDSGPASEPAQDFEERRTMRSPAPPNTHDEKYHILIVNGVEKKISKKSRYLLDMLTLDDE